MDRSEYMTAEEARLMLGYTKAKMARLLDGPDKLLEYDRNPVDKRMKLLKRADVERLTRYPKANPTKHLAA